MGTIINATVGIDEYSDVQPKPPPAAADASATWPTASAKTPQRHSNDGVKAGKGRRERAAKARAETPKPENKSGAVAEDDPTVILKMREACKQKLAEDEEKWNKRNVTEFEGWKLRARDWEADGEEAVTITETGEIESVIADATKPGADRAAKLRAVTLAETDNELQAISEILQDNCPLTNAAGRCFNQYRMDTELQMAKS